MATIQPRTILSKRGRTVLIRSMCSDDAEALLALNDHVRTTAPEFSVTQAHEVKATVESEEKEIAEHAASPVHCSVAAECEGKLVGETTFRGHTLGRLAHHGHIGIGVHADFRDDGVGRMLMQAIIDWARASPSIEEVRLGVFANNPRAIALYTSLGFVEQWRQPRAFKFGPGQYTDDIQMVLAVK